MEPSNKKIERETATQLAVLQIEPGQKSGTLERGDVGMRRQLTSAHPVEALTAKGMKVRGLHIISSEGGAAPFLASLRLHFKDAEGQEVLVPVASHLKAAHFQAHIVDVPVPDTCSDSPTVEWSSDIGNFYAVPVRLSVVLCYDGAGQWVPEAPQAK